MFRIPLLTRRTVEPAETTTPVPRRRRGPVRWIVATSLLVVLAGGAYFGYTQLLQPPTPTPTTQTYSVRRGAIMSTVSSSGSVATQTQMKLSFPSSGTSGSVLVTEVGVTIGDAVTKGQELAKLDTKSLGLAITQAQASLASAQAKLATIEAGPVTADVESAKAAVNTAKTNLEKVKAGPTAADLASAEQALATAQVSLSKAKTDRDTLKAGATSQEIKGAQLAVNQAKVSLWQAAADRDQICDNAKSTEYQCTQARYKVTSASYAVTNAENNLAKLKTPASAESLNAAEKSVVAAEAQVQSAQAKLAEVKAGPKAEDVAAAEAQLLQAENNLKKAQTPYTEADLQTAQAAVDQAQAALETAQQNLENATLRAPLDGVVSAVAVNVGEAPASPAITIVDLKNLRLDATVDESDISRIQVGQRVAVTADSIPDRVWQGKVSTVAPTATMQSGVALYQVQITLNDAEGLKPGMIGNASVVHGEAQNALIVPNRALRTQGRNRVVDVLVDGQQQARVVKVGVSNDQFTEITEGLAEGDQVVISGTTTSTTRIPGAGQFGVQVAPGAAPAGPVVAPGGQGGRLGGR